MPPREEGSSINPTPTTTRSSADSTSSVAQGVDAFGHPLPSRLHNTTTVHRPRVRFQESVRVILIPHRSEYQRANCSLWYHRLDVFRTQRVALNEIRLLALFQNISLDEAKRKLYQPDLDPEGTCWDYLPQGEDGSPASSTVSSPDLAASSFRKVLKTKKSTSEEDFTFLSPTKLPQATTTHIRHVETFSSSIQQDAAMHSDLHFCVLCTETIPLRCGESSGSNKRLSRHCSRSTSTLQQQGFGVLAGCAVVTLSVVGFYCANFFSSATL